MLQCWPSSPRGCNKGSCRGWQGLLLLRGLGEGALAGRRCLEASLYSSLVPSRVVCSRGLSSAPWARHHQVSF
jgi:hypothetical protein